MALIDTADFYSPDLNPVSNTLNVGSGADRGVYWFVTTQGGVHVTGCNITGGTALTLLGSSVTESGSYGNRYLFGVQDPTETGNQTITCTTDGSGGIRYGVGFSWDSTSGSRTPTLDAQLANPVDIETGSSPSDSVFLIGHLNARGGGITPVSPATELLDNGDAYILVRGADTGATTIIEGTAASSGSWSAAAIALIPAGPTGFTLLLEHGTLASTGQTVSFLAARSVALANGALALTGQDVSFVKETPGAYVLALDAGVYVFTGQDALVDLSMNLDGGSHSFAGQDLDFIRTFPQNYTLALDGGTYTSTGSAIALRWSGAPIVPSTGTGVSMSLRIGL